jgi:multimeric flavodoxin WrbA
MAISVLGISSSPRAGSNSDLLLEEALAGAAEAGADCRQVTLRKLTISPCLHCGGCRKDGRCVINDAFQPIYEGMLAADRMVFAMPVYFMSPPAQAKLLIDRCQSLWTRKYVLKAVPPERLAADLRGMAIAVGGCRSRKMFDGIGMAMKYFYDVLQMQFAYGLWVNGIDERGEIREHPAALAEARRMGRLLVTAPRRERSKPQTRLLVGGEPEADRAPAP